MIADRDKRLLHQPNCWVGKPAFGVLEPGAVKAARRVLRGVRGW